MNSCPFCGSNEVNTSGYCWKHQHRAFSYPEKPKKKLKGWGLFKGLKISEEEIEESKNFGKGIIIPDELYKRLINALENWLEPCDCDMGKWYEDLLKKIKALK